MGNYLRFLSNYIDAYIYTWKNKNKKQIQYSIYGKELESITSQEIQHSFNTTVSSCFRQNWVTICNIAQSPEKSIITVGPFLMLIY